MSDDNINTETTTDDVKAQEIAEIEQLLQPVSEQESVEDTEQPTETEPTEDKPKKKAGRPKKPAIVETEYVRTEDNVTDVHLRDWLPALRAVTDRNRKQVSDLRAKPVQLGTMINVDLLFESDQAAEIKSEMESRVDPVNDQWQIGGLIERQRGHVLVFLGTDKAGNIDFLVGSKGSKVVRLRQNKAGANTFSLLTTEQLMKTYNLSVQYNNVDFHFWITDLLKPQFNWPPAKPEKKTAAKSTSKTATASAPTPSGPKTRRVVRAKAKAAAK